jgi:hypothetical protein
MPVTHSHQFFAQFVDVEAFISDQQHGEGFCPEQVHDMRSLISLSRDQLHLQGPPAQIGDDHQPGVSSASDLAHRLSLRSAAGIGGALMRHHVCSVHQPDRTAPGAGHCAQLALPQTGVRPVAIIAKDGQPGAEFARQAPPGAGITQPVE